MSDDKQLPRLVVAGLIVATVVALVCTTLLKLKGIDSDLSTIVAGGVGALAGFLSRGRTTGGTDTPSA